MITMITGGFVLPMSLILIFNLLIWRLLKTNHIMYYYLRKYSQKKPSLNISVYFLTKSLNSDIYLQRLSNQTKKQESEKKDCLNNKSVDQNNSPSGNSCFIDFKKHSEVSSNSAIKETRFLKRRNACRMSRLCTNESDKSNYFVKREIKVLKRLILSILLFCIAWLPYLIIVLVAQFGSNIQNFVTPYNTSIPAIIAKFTILINPIIYMLLEKERRRYFFRWTCFMK
jgi:hypothetical protein